MNSRLAVSRFPLKRSTAAIALALGLGLAGADAFAFGLGEPEVTTSLGQPLQMRVPVQTDPEVDLTPSCLHLLGTPHDALPTLTQARMVVESQGKDTFLRIESLYPINDPILRVVIDAGCVRHVQREFTLLLDPPTASAPSASLPALLPPAALQSATLSPEGDVNVAPPNATIANVVGPIAMLDLGVARVRGRMGETIVVQIPVTGSEAGMLDDGSVRTARVLTADGSPLRNPALVSLARTDTTTTVQLITPDPVAEPALRVVIELATARATVRREYGVLLDLPAPKAAEPTSGMPEAAALPVPAPIEPPPAVKPTEGPGAATEAAPKAAEPIEAAPAPAPEEAKPRKTRVHKVPKSLTPQELPTAPANAAPEAAAPAKSAGKPAKAAAPAVEAPAAPGANDHLVLAAPDPNALANAQRFSEMEQRVKDLTQEIVRLRADLASQKQHESELVAQQSTGGISWILAVLALVGVGVGAVLYVTRRRSNQAWAPDNWETAGGASVSGNTVIPARPPRAKSPNSAPHDEAAAIAAAAAAAGNANDKALKSGGRGASQAGRGSGPATQPNTDPITLSALTTPIEVTEVAGNEASIDQLYTLFYDVGGNTTPGGALPPSVSLPGVNSGVPTIDMARNDSLDIDLGIPESITSAKQARAQTALKAPSSGAASSAASSTASGAKPASFTYEDKPASKPPLDLDQVTNVGPMTEMPKEAEFAKTQPGLDLDLTTNIATPSQLGMPTVMPRDDAPKPAPAPAQPLANAAPPLAARAAPPLPGATPARGPAELELDLSTNIGSVTQVGGPMTVMPREDDDPDPKTRVELDLDLNTNIVPLDSEPTKKGPALMPDRRDPKGRS